MPALRRRLRSFTPALESLESRLAPAIGTLTIGGTTIASFTDADGDVITARIAGKAGTAVFDDGSGGTVDNGEAIAKITITGASSDFQLTLSVNSSGGGANGHVQMGEITASTVIRGVFTVADITSGPGSDFELKSFTGPGFSRGGGLFVTNITGNTAGDGVVLNSLDSKRVINVRDELAADIRITGIVAGTINVGEFVTSDSAWTLGSVLSTGLITVGGPFDGEVTVLGSFSGVASLRGNANGPWNVGGSVLSSARLTSVHWGDVHVEGDFHGQIVSEGTGDIALEVDGNLGSKSRIASIQAVDLTVHKSILAGAQILAEDDITAEVDGDVRGLFASYGAVSLDVGGSLNGASVHVGHSDMSVSVDGDVLRSSLVAQQGITVDIDGFLRDSLLSTTSTISLDLGGSLLKSTLAAGDEVTADIDGGVVDSVITSGSGTSLDIGGSVVRTRIDSASSETILHVGGDLVRSEIAGGSAVSAEIDFDVRGSSIVSTASDISLTVGGSVRSEGSKASTIRAEEDVTLDVTGSVSRGTVVSGDQEVSIDAVDFDGSVTANILDFEVTGNVGRYAVLQTWNVADLSVDLNDTGFSVAGTFAGKLTVTGDFDSGSGASTTLVGLGVARTAKLDIAGPFGAGASADAFVFGGDFLGELIIGDDLVVDLTFGGNVRKVTIAGVVDEDIVVAGVLEFLSSGSLFDATVAGFDGDFVDGAGAVTGTLDTAGGFKKVIPLV